MDRGKKMVGIIMLLAGVSFVLFGCAEMASPGYAYGSGYIYQPGYIYPEPDYRGLGLFEGDDFDRGRAHEHHGAHGDLDRGHGGGFGGAHGAGHGGGHGDGHGGGGGHGR